MTHYPMKRFPDLIDGTGGLFEHDGKQYDVGAFSWSEHDGVRYLTFRRPDKIWDKGYGYSTIEVNNGKWTWDGNLDAPTISPSIQNMTSHPDHDDWVETFHGFVRDGVLEDLG